ncbi:peptide deformylase [Thiohalorhabdus methylotrophus]|uniref:Peptide deformylase n=1 Tax=Thiohalorhabdus methylotrophus TaxID=3242694 RepID=A0ABV4TVA5_9GAMM
MPVREVIRMGDPRLNRKAAPVEELDTRALHDLVQDLWDTMEAYQGIGIAAPQIGVEQRVIVFGLEKSARYPEAEPVPRTVLVNPEYEVIGDEYEEIWDGCLSVPGLRGVIPRYVRIRYWGYSPAGELIERTAEHTHAMVVQHECDHLDGILYPLRIRDLRQFGFEQELFGRSTDTRPDAT